MRHINNITRRAFTLTEVMLAVAIMSLVISGSLGIYVTCAKTYRNTDVQVRAARTSAMAVQKMVYGVNGSNGIRSAFSTNIVLFQTQTLWSVSYSVPDGSSHFFSYVPTNNTLIYTNSMLGSRVITVATHVAFATASNSGTGLDVTLQSLIQEGSFKASNTLATFIHYRN